ncbi:carbohydrate ABC transporter permease [Ruminiclostridium cellobioparum]|jgi:multiple sugar transport system permease protein|uniref:Sugar ABC transporter, permease protein n=1 Tax=Ruminiclostridium cellobioparum subsp. termitidis CT1112 TaxID=1195236 RepID=S0FHI8_RUMCE|nr:sugar ABC transporter permease [Ruminiclostridium cellobioparum]EMS69341.1 sugar ABC transporter, permease protein [Ruminiclostridium cellobioparum subsp. termitidis CT1112]
MQLSSVKKNNTRLNRNKFLPYLFIAPNMLLFLTFMIIPIIFTFTMSFTKWTLIGTPEFNGISNYVKLLSDKQFLAAMLNTVYYTLATVPTTLALGLIGAIALNRNMPLRGALRGIFYIPTVVSLVATGLIWQWILSTDYGVLNYVLEAVGIGEQQWLTSNALSMPSVILATIWVRCGYCMVIYLGGLQGISQDYYEAAEIDGAGDMKKFKYITWPLLRSTTVFLTVMSIIYGFMGFDLFYTMTGGGPGFSSTVMVHYIYKQAFQVGEMGYASAGGVVLFLIIFILTLLQMKGDDQQ